MKNIFFLLFFLICVQTKIHADLPRYLDFKYVLNNSEAGKKAQNTLKKKLDSGISSLKEKEKKIQEEEKKIISKKKIITPDEYKKQIIELRSKVQSLQKERNSLLQTVAKQRAKARNELLKNLNPIIQEFMKENKVRMVVDKKSLLLADENLDITLEITKRLDKKLKSIKLN